MIKKRSKSIPSSRLVFTGNEEKYVLDAVHSTWVSSIGKYVNQFEEDFASYLGVQYAVSVSNGTCALLLALKVLDIGPGDEVIVPSFTFAATVNAVLHAGANPVLIDCLPNHWNLDPGQVEQAVSPATKAIIPVHLYGHPCEMKAILDIAEKNNLFVIEDAAEAHNAVCLGKKVGTLGTIGCFSFYGNKVMTTGEGGMCVTSDPELDHRMRKLRDHGMSNEKRYWHEEIGYNFRMTNLNAALGLAQLEQIESFLARRSYLTKIYESSLKHISGLKKPIKSPFGKKIDWLFCLFLEESFPLSRDELLLALKECKIDARPTFYPIHSMPPYIGLKRVGSLRNAELFGYSGIVLPLYPSLQVDDIHYIAEVMENIAYAG